MKSKSMLGAMLAALAANGLGGLFAHAIFAKDRRVSDPFRRRHRSHGSPHWVYCGQCRRTVNGRSGRKHRCIAPFVPAPPRGKRWQNGSLVARHARGAGAA